MKLEYRNAEFRDLPEIKRLMDEYIAEDYYTLEELEKMLQGERDLLYVVTDAECGNAVVSYFYAFLAPVKEALKILHVSQMPDALRPYGENALAGVYKASSTQKAYRRLGICSSFVSSLQPVMRDHGARMILATALHPLGREVPMRHIFRENGFTAISQIHQPWVHTRAYCPYCKQEYCICDGVFYMKELNDTEDGEFHE